MNWLIDKNQDTRLTALQKSVLDLIPPAPSTIRSREIADILAKEQSQISDIPKKLTDKRYILSPHYGEADNSLKLVKLKLASKPINTNNLQAKKFYVSQV